MTNRDLRHATRHDQIFPGTYADPYVLAVRAFVWGFPLVQMARIRLHGTQPDDHAGPPPASSTRAPLNHWGHQTVPADPAFRAGVGPSVDLLYSSLRLDLADGPFVVEVPDCGSRYYTVQVALADSSAEESYGQRTHGRRLPPLFLCAPGSGDRAPDGALEIRSLTRYCLLPARFLFDPDDPADLARVRRLQTRLRVRTLDAYLAGSDTEPPISPQRALRDPSGDVPGSLAFLNELGSVLRDWVVRSDERELVGQLARIGLSTVHGFDASHLPRAALDDLTRGLADGADIVRRKSLALGSQRGGWTTNYLGPRFGQDWLLRAGVAKDQIVVTVPEEALYPVCRADCDGRPLDGRHNYRLLFPRHALPPVAAFWSVTLYDDDGFLVDNVLGRHAIGDRTAGLHRTADGGLDITIGHRRPAETTNWLPAPPAPFYLMLRLYLPRPEALDGRWRPPPVQRVPD